MTFRERHNRDTKLIIAIICILTAIALLGKIFGG
jgi:hypothetical protein